MLKMKATCERCGAPVAADGDATVCSYECTFCVRCTDELQSVCPNCGGELVRRPRRTTGATAVAARAPMRGIRLLRRNRG
jgi:hypothetical protein